MKKTIKNFVSIFCLLLICISMAPPEGVMAAETVTVNHVYLTCNSEDKKDVTRYVAELETGIMDTAHFDVELETPASGLTYKLFQYDAGADKRYDLGSFSSPSFDVDTTLFVKNLPAYIAIFRGSTQLSTTLLTMRVKQGRVETFAPEEIGSEYKDNLQVNMDELLPGMKFEMYPYIIPITCKAYTDGRVVIGMGLNSSNVSFWNNARNGTLSQKTDVKKLSDAFWGNSKNRSAVTGGNMGLVIDFTGWVQGNIYSTEPMKGELSLYFGSGFYISGQYAILTWDVTVTAGAAGVLDFEFRYNEEKSKYDDFYVDSFAITFKAGLELYGGVGLSSIASVGVYGAGSITGRDQYYPDPVIQSLILAGEVGFKVKMFSRTIFSFAIVSGSHEFVKDKLGGQENTALLNTTRMDDINGALLEAGYASSAGTIKEPEDSGTWYSGMQLKESGELQGFEPGPDFDDLVAENVYPDTKLQVVDTGSRALPQMNVVFIQSDGSRANGNRGRLANFYYSEYDNFISKPVWVLDEDDGTADYNPHAYSNARGDVFWTGVVWQNALREFDDTSTFEDIAGNIDLYYSQYQVGADWHPAERVTYFVKEEQAVTGEPEAGTVPETGEASDAQTPDQTDTEDTAVQEETAQHTEADGPAVFPTGARMSEDPDGNPIIAYYTELVSDPAGMDPSTSHDIYIARRAADGTWTSEKAFTVTGAVTDFETAVFSDAECVAVSYYTQDGSGKQYHVELWKNGSSWSRVFERTASGTKTVSTGRFVRAGNGASVLTWYENKALYCVRNSSYSAEKLTKDDVTIPTGDYQIYGNFAKGRILIVLKGSKDSSENAYAIQSTNGGITWGRVGLTEIAKNASVSDIQFGFTNEDEPVMFYCVQNYSVNGDLDMSYLEGDGETLLSAPLQGMYKELENGLFAGLLLGQDDPRFTDTTTDMYIKSRKANQSVSITYAEFEDETGAKRGEATPVTFTVENTGLYDISSVTLYAGDEKIGDFSIDLKTGQSTEIKTSVTVPADAPDEAYEFTFRSATREGATDSEYKGTLGVGTIDVKFLHQLRYGNETLVYQVTNNGFPKKRVFIYLFDEETGENFYQYGLYVPPHTTQESQTSMLGGLWKQMGHEKVKAYLVTEEESKLAPSGTPLDKFEEILDLDTSRFLHLEGLDEIFLQDASGAFKVKTPQQQEDPAPAPAPAQDTVPSQSGNSGKESTEPAPAKDDIGKKEDKPAETDSKEPENSIPEENTSKPEDSTPSGGGEPSNGGNGSKRSYIVPVLAGIGILFLGTALFLFFLFKRRDEDEEEENKDGGDEPKAE